MKVNKPITKIHLLGVEFQKIVRVEKLVEDVGTYLIIRFLLILTVLVVCGRVYPRFLSPDRSLILELFKELTLSLLFNTAAACGGILNT